MKKILLILIPAIGFGAYGAYGAYTTYRSNTSYHPAANLSSPNPPTATLTDPVAVFQKAFWKRPTGDDEITHAERHEWSDAEGVTKWQWFIEVKASPDLVKYLQQENAFGLIPAASAQLLEERPGWFRFDPGEVSVMKSPRGRMQLIFSTKNNTLYATDSGAGFQRGAPEPAAAATAAVPPAGRLPNTSPPTPKP